MNFDLSFVEGLTVKEKAELIVGHDFWFTEGNTKRNIPKIMMTDGPSGLRKQADGADALGLNDSVQAISFPSSALTASSFNIDMLYKLGQNLGKAAKSENVSILLGPGINIKRSPLAGRNFEYFSEDPYLSGELGKSYVNGVQNEGVGVSVKHFAANNRENQRFTSSSNVDERALREIYLSAFEKIIKESHPATIMCSYNAINGVLSSQNGRLLTNILRNEWGFEGLVMSDWGAVADTIAALKAGLDLEMPGNDHYSVEIIEKAINTGELELSVLNRASLRVLKMVEKFHFESKSKFNYDKEEQHNFAREAAEDSIVLLKNKNNILPLKQGQKIAIIGSLAEKPRYQGGGSSHVNAYKVVTPLQAVSESSYETYYAPGYRLDRDEKDSLLEKQAIDLSKNKDVVLFFAGVPEKDESEGFDKKTIDLPINQINLLNKLAQVNKNIVVVLQNGSAVAMPWQESAHAIVETYLAGEAVGEATWNILTGKVNPSGKLAESFPVSISDTPAYGTFNSSIHEENYHEGIFVGYRYYDIKNQQVNFPFGHGLSYTEFKYQDLSIFEHNNEVTVSVSVTNVGNRDGKETVQIYVQNLVSSIEKPLRELKAFSKVYLRSGESKSVTLNLNRRSFAWYDVSTNGWHVDNGEYNIQVGSSSRNIKLEEKVSITLGTDVISDVTPDTYISEIIKRYELKQALEMSGMKQLFDQLLMDDSNRELLENLPLRAIVMVGGTIDQMNNFIQLANQNQSTN